MTGVGHIEDIATNPPTDLHGTPSHVRTRIFIVLIVLASFGRLLGADFGGFDDDQTVARNPQFNPPTVRSLRQIWTTPQHDLYVPLTGTVWWAVAHVAYDANPERGPQLDPTAFHLLNLLLHMGSALVVFEVLRCTVNRVSAATIGALVFAVHPLQVEAVAWISGTKDVLAGLLALVALWQYLKSDEPVSHRRKSYVIGTIAFILAMLSKPGVVVLPLIAWVLEVLALHRPVRSASFRALPWLILAIPCAVWTRLFQPAQYEDLLIPFWQRPIVAMDAVAFYLWKLLIPLELAVDYGRTPRSVLGEASSSPWLLLPIVVTAVAVLLRRRLPMLSIGLAVFVIALLPVLGLIAFDFQLYSTVADHYIYLPMLGPALVVAALITRFGRPLTIVAIPLVIGLATLSNLQARHWRDGMTIFSHALEVNPQSWIAHRQVAEELAARGQLERAIEHAKRAVELNDRALVARLTLASKLALAGETKAAIDAYEAALDLDPHNAIVNVELGNLFFKLEQFDRAIERYRAALDAHPASPIVHANLAVAYEQSGQLELAQHYFEAALRLAPHDTDAQQGLQRVTARLRQ